MQAYHRGLVYPKYVWITTGTPQWWTEIPESNSSCPHQLVAEALLGSLSFLPNGYVVDKDDVFDTLSGEVDNYNNFVVFIIHNHSYI